MLQGLLRMTKDYYKEPVKVVRLWVHECERVLSDRMINDTDMTKFNEFRINVTKKHFDDINQVRDFAAGCVCLTFSADLAMPATNLFISICQSCCDTSLQCDQPWSIYAVLLVMKHAISMLLHDLQGEVEARPLLYNNFMTVTADDNPVYNAVPGYEQLRKTLNDKLAEYNESNAVMDLVLFQQAMEHICRITRIISQPRGNAMLVGVGGSGKQSLARLASPCMQSTTAAVY